MSEAQYRAQEKRNVLLVFVFELNLFLNHFGLSCDVPQHCICVCVRTCMSKPLLETKYFALEVQRLIFVVVFLKQMEKYSPRQFNIEQIKFLEVAIFEFWTVGQNKHFRGHYHWLWEIFVIVLFSFLFYILQTQRKILYLKNKVFIDVEN